MIPTRSTNQTAHHVAKLLDAVMDVGLGELESIIQQAHESDVKQIEDPEEVFPVSRQALRMFWRFRSNLETIPKVRVCQ